MSIQPCNQSTEWHQPSHRTHFHRGSVSAGKPLTQLGTTVAKAHTVPTPEQLCGAQGERETISSLSHTIFWGVQGLSMYQTHILPTQKKAQIGQAHDVSPGCCCRSCARDHRDLGQGICLNKARPVRREKVHPCLSHPKFLLCCRLQQRQVKEEAQAHVEGRMRRAGRG